MRYTTKESGLIDVVKATEHDIALIGRKVSLPCAMHLLYTKIDLSKGEHGSFHAPQERIRRRRFRAGPKQEKYPVNDFY